MIKLKKIVFLFTLFTVLSTSSVYALWSYSGKIGDTKAPVGVQMGSWSPEVVLPDSEGGLLGTDHSVMIGQILNNSNSGLNPKPQVLLNAIKNEKKNPFASQGLFYSELEKVTGGNLKFLFEANIVNVDFVMERIEEDQAYYFYTYHAPSQNEVDKNIKTYRTLVEKVNGTWEATQTAEGVAPV